MSRIFVNEAVFKDSLGVLKDLADELSKHYFHPNRKMRSFEDGTCGFVMRQGNLVLKTGVCGEYKRWEELVGKRLRHFPETLIARKVRGKDVILRKWVPDMKDGTLQAFKDVMVKVREISDDPHPQDAIMSTRKEIMSKLKGKELSVYRQLIMTIEEAKALGLGRLDIHPSNFGESNGRLVCFDPFF